MVSISILRGVTTLAGEHRLDLISLGRRGSTDNGILPAVDLLDGIPYAVTRSTKLVMDQANTFLFIHTLPIKEQVRDIDVIIGKEDVMDSCIIF